MTGVPMKRRDIVNFLTLAAGVLLLYVGLNTVLTLLRLLVGNNAITAAESDLPVIIKSIAPSGDGKLDLTLSISIDDILRHLEGYRHANGEATSNPIPRNSSFLLNVPELCSREPSPLYLIAIHSSPGNEQRRQNVRRTWGDVALFEDGRTKMVFLTGVPDSSADQKLLDEEHRKYGDIVQGDFVDHYRNLTLKGLLGLQWVRRYCPQARYVIKADDDAFVNIFGLLKEIDAIAANSQDERMVMCPLWKDNTMPILRDPAKCMKWCVKYSEFPGRNYFPKYCAGLTYVLSTDMMADMLSASRRTPFFWIDDVYITGLLLAKVSGVRYVDIMRNFTLKEKLAVDEYLDEEVRHTHYAIAHVKNSEKWTDMWTATLNRLSDAQLKTLSVHVTQDNERLRERWQKLRSG